MCSAYITAALIQEQRLFLGQLTESALIFPPFPLTPKQCCSLKTQYTLPCPKSVWWEGWTIQGIQTVTEVHMMLHLHI